MVFRPYYANYILRVYNPLGSPETDYWYPLQEWLWSSSHTLFSRAVFQTPVLWRPTLLHFWFGSQCRSEETCCRLRTLVRLQQRAPRNLGSRSVCLRPQTQRVHLVCKPNAYVSTQQMHGTFLRNPPPTMMKSYDVGVSSLACWNTAAKLPTK